MYTKLEALDVELRDKPLVPVQSSKPFIVFHDGYHWLRKLVGPERHRRRHC